MYSRYSHSELEHFAEMIEKLFDRKFNEFFDRLEKGIKEDNFIDMREACKILGITRATLHNWIKDRRISHFKKGGRCYFNKLYIKNLYFFYKNKGLTVRKPDKAVYEDELSRYNHG